MMGKNEFYYWEPIAWKLWSAEGALLKNALSGGKSHAAIAFAGEKCSLI